MNIHIQTLIFIAGLAQIGLVIGSLAVPKVLNWKYELMPVAPLIKQMFWVYAAYIICINLCFGLISVFASANLNDGSMLALLINGFIALYWISRVLIQFFYFDRANFPQGKWHKLAEIFLVALFIFLSTVYCMAFYSDL